MVSWMSSSQVLGHCVLGLYNQYSIISLGSIWPVFQVSIISGMEKLKKNFIGECDVVIKALPINDCFFSWNFVCFQPSWSIFFISFAGNNGTIDGQGKMWWELWWNRTLKHTRGHLVEIMNSQNVLISNLTFQNSPFWTLHPVYCRCNNWCLLLWLLSYWCHY